MKLSKLSLVAGISMLGFSIHAFPIASSGTEGFQVIVGSGNPIIATYEGNSAAYSNDLLLERDALGNPGMDGILGNDLFIFNNHANSPGDIFNLGIFTPGVELVFRLHVNNTGNDFYTGPASRNPDNQFHARVQDNYLPSTTLVSFEDLLNGPFDFNDLSFSFSNTRSTGSVPEILTTGIWLGLSFFGMATIARRVRAK